MPTDPTANPWARLARRSAYENPWIQVWHDEVLRPDGQPGIYGVVHYKHIAVGVVARNAQGEVLLVGQYRYTLDRYSWEIPEGGARHDEDPLRAAQRELQEETGYTAQGWQLLLQAHLSNSVSDELAYCYLATDLTPGPAQPEGTEDLQVAWVPFATVLSRIAAGEITDALSILGLHQLAMTSLLSD